MEVCIMDLKDKIRKSNGNTGSQAPFRQSGADRSAYVTSGQRSRNPNRQAPRSVQYQPEPELESQNIPDSYGAPNQQPAYAQGFTPQQPPIYQQDFTQQNSTNEAPMQQQFHQPAQVFMQQGGMPAPNENLGTVNGEQDAENMLDLNAFFGSKQETQDMFQQKGMPLQLNNDTTVPQGTVSQMHSPINNSQPHAQTEQTVEEPKTVKQPETKKNKTKIKNDFIGLISNIFARYEIDKVLIVDGKIYTVNFTGEEDSEIFEEDINKEVINDFAMNFADIGYTELTIEDGIRIEMTCPPVSPETTIIASKMEFDLYIDEDFVRILFEFLIKRKNVAILSSCALDTLYKVVSDFYDNEICVTINEPIKTNKNITFYENPACPSLKTVYSITSKIAPDNVLVYTPNDILFTITHMKRHSGVVLFSETDNAADFINADIIHALGGVSEYNRVSTLKAIDIIFTVTKTKDGKTKYVATQLLSPTNKSHVNKIKRIVGEGEIDMGKIYFNNVFEKEI